jgi:hypothetical protein
VELPSGRRIWDTSQPISQRPVGTGTAFIVRQGDAGNRFWLFNDSGDLIIAELSPEGSIWRKSSRHTPCAVATGGMLSVVRP